MQHQTSEAVLFFDNDKIVKEMLYSEFEAVLDDVVGIQEFVDKNCNAVFIKINPQLKVLAAVFFTIKFMADGSVDRNWNLPLVHLSEISGRGPDLGAGTIRLACRSQCPIPWHQRSMWDPLMSAEGNSFVAIRSVIARNRLGLVEEELLPTAAALAEPPVLQSVQQSTQSPPGQPLSLSVPELTSTMGAAGTDDLSTIFAQQERDKAARLIKRLRLQIATLDTRRRDEQSAVSIEHVSAISEYQHSLAKMKKALVAERKKNKTLKKSVSEQEAEFQLVSEQFLDQVDEAKALEKSQLAALAKKFELELKGKIETESAQLKEMLDMREVELHYRDEQISNLRDEVSDLRCEKQRLLTEGGDKFLEKLGSSGITFVAYHPGTGHLTIPVAEAGEYLDSPTLYVAKKLFVSKARYLEWLDHYQSPVCSHSDSSGECRESIDRVDGPGHYIPGKSDRCARHVLSAASYDDVASSA